jgi:hypothetical protein
MDLRDFVSETLIQIIDGVRAAQEHASQVSAEINPSNIQHFGGDNNQFFRPAGLVGKYGHIVEFDIALTPVNEEQAKGGGFEILSVLDAGVQGKAETSNNATNRIHFAIPIIMPKQ